MLEEVTSPSMVKKIREYYGNEAEKIVENLEIEKLLEVPGLGKKTALSILRKAYELKTGEVFQDILSDDAQEVYEDIILLLQEYPCTQQAKNRFLVHYPVKNAEIIKKRLLYSEKALEFVRSLEKDQLEQLLEKLRQLKPLTLPKKKKYRERIIAVDGVDAYTALKNDYCDVFLIEDPADISMLEQYPLVVYVYTGESALYEYILEYSDFQFLLEDFSIEEVIPELKIDAFTQNEKTIFVMWEIAEILQVHDATLSQVRDALLQVKEKTTYQEIDIDTMVAVLEREVDLKFDEAMQKEQVELKGNQILTMMQQMQTDPVQALKRSIPDSVIALYDRLIAEANKTLSEKIGVQVEVFSLELSYPIEADQRKVEQLKDELKKTESLKEFRAKRDAARIGQYWDYIQEKERELHELDFQTALGRFFADYHMSPPQFIDTGLSFKNGINLIVKNPQPVTYTIGETPHQFSTADHIVVLTGANSGGKTTLLETILHLQILAQMGFYIPAEEGFCPLFEEILYLRKPKSQDAGAFESTITKLVPLALSETKKLVLIDELEAITEPGSAAKIIASFLNFLAQNKTTLCVLVTHLGKEISELTRARIDGIEASGLDEQLELIVNRQPVFGKLGKSTPELIVEKLFKRSTGTEKEVYERILHDFGTP
jgi:dsDNA-specific endonuclease/ATPase MutS2